MDFDIRIPIGLVFLAIGAILAIDGLVADPEVFQRISLGVNVNLAWGLVLALFGAVMLGLALIHRRAQSDRDQDPARD